MKLKKMLAAITAVSLAVSTMSAAGFTASADDEIAETIVSVQADAAANLPDNAELEAMYLNQLFYGDYGISLYKDYGKTHLTGTQLAVYNALRTKIESVASGTITKTQFEITVADVTFDDIGAAIDCLMVDLPQAFYWYDKTTGCGQSLLGDDATITFAVANDYFKTGGETAEITFDNGSKKNYQIEVDPTKITAAQTAVGNANSIITANSGKSAIEKVKAYKDAICGLTDYDFDAIADDYNGGYGDPWQLVHVFDDDSETKVVCEGYSKAFQYLCDLGGVECYTVTGDMDGGTGAGPHMWNIVTVDGKNYLVDVTNCDDESVGYSDLLCLKEAAVSSASGCTMNCNGNEVVYVYDADTLALYSSSLLTVEAERAEIAVNMWTTLSDEEYDSWDAYINTTETTEYDDLSRWLILDEGKSITDVASIRVRWDVIDVNGDVVEGVSAASGTYGIVRGDEWVEDLSYNWDNEHNIDELTFGNDIQEGDEFCFAIYTLPQNTGVAFYFEVEYVSAGSEENPIITVIPHDVSLAVGEIYQLSVSVTGGDRAKITWESSNPSVATVNEYGVVTAVGNGGAEIRALYDGTFLMNQSTNYAAVTVSGGGSGSGSGSGSGGGSESGSTPSTSAPATSNNPAPVSQTTVVDTILATPDGGNGSINLGSSTKVDKLAIEAIAEKGDVTIKLSVAGGAYWEINGKNVTDAKDVNLGVKVNSKQIPASKVEAFAGDKVTIQLTLSHNGDLGFTGTLNVPVGSSNNGKFANLYYYHGGKFDFVGSSAITGGRAQFAFSHASNYLIVIDDYAYGEDVSSAASMTETAGASAVPYAAILAVISAFGAFAVVLKKRLSK